MEFSMNNVIKVKKTKQNIAATTKKIDKCYKKMGLTYTKLTDEK